MLTTSLTLFPLYYHYTPHSLNSVLTGLDAPCMGFFFPGTWSSGIPLRILLLLPYAVQSVPLTLTVPSDIVACDKTIISWEGGSAPYTLTVEVNGVTLESTVINNATTFDWDVDIGPGMPVVLTLVDNNKEKMSSSQSFIKPGSQNCEIITATTPPMSTPTGAIGEANSDRLRPVTRSATSTKDSSSPTAASNTSPSGAALASSGQSSRLRTSVIGFIVLAVILAILIGVIGVLFWIRRRKQKRVRVSVDLLAEGKVRSAESFEIVHSFGPSTPSTPETPDTFDHRTNPCNGGKIVQTFTGIIKLSATSNDATQRLKSDYEYPSSTYRPEESSFTPTHQSFIGYSPSSAASHSDSDLLFARPNPSVCSAESELSPASHNPSSANFLNTGTSKVGVKPMVVYA